MTGCGQGSLGSQSGMSTCGKVPRSMGGQSA